MILSFNDAKQPKANDELLKLTRLQKLQITY